MSDGGSDSRKSPLRRLNSFIKPYALWAVIKVTGSIVDAACDIFFAYILMSVVNTTVYGQKQDLVRIIYLFVAVTAIGVFVSFLNRYSSGRLGASVMYEIREAISLKLQRLRMSYMDSNHSGDIVSRMTNDVVLVRNYVENDFASLIYQPLRFIGTFLFMFFVNWKLLLLSLILMPAVLVLANKLSNPIGKHTKQLQEYLGKLNSLAQDVIGGIYILKAFNIKERLYKKYSDAVDESLKKSLSVEKLRAAMEPVNAVLKVVPFVLCIVYGGYLTVNGKMSAGGLIAFIQMLNYLLEPIIVIPMLLGNVKAAMSAAGRIFEILDQTDEHNGNKVNGAEGPLPIVEFSGVSFSYDRHIKVLNNLNFNLYDRKVTALVGHSGSGKTTIFKLLCGFYNPQEGSVLLHGVNLNEWDIVAARKEIALVSQDTYLFSATIYENISYGSPAASQAEIIAASKAANAHDFIMELPNGYDTAVGERGSMLSVGQRQRIAIARAILKDSPILLLDEPTSALDPESEAAIKDVLENIMKRHSVFVIAHRLSTIKKADEILVMDEGSIVERGTHIQLMNNNGLYTHLYRKQFAPEHSRTDGEAEVEEVEVFGYV